MKRAGGRFAAKVIGTLIFASPTCSQGGDVRANWQNVEADNGAIYKVDLNSISHYNNGTADVVVYAVEGSSYNPENMRRLWFDCQGRFRDETGRHIGPAQYAPPRSIAGRIGEIACVGAKDTRLEESSRPQPKDTAAQYCKGFSPDACWRIKAAAEANQKPIYCKPGFGLVTSGLSAEQIRICSVVANEEARLKNTAATRSAKEGSEDRTYNLTLTATRSNFPNIVGSTNLPDGTKLLVSINKPRLPNARELLAAGLPMCEEDCLPASGPKGETLGVGTVVLSGAFSAGPFSWRGKPFRQGAFEVEIFLVSLAGENVTSLEDIYRQSDRMKKPILTTSVVVAP
jgi:hypothetical protein